MSNSVRDQVVAILADQALMAPAEVSDGAELADLGIDSMTLVEAIFRIEETFDIQVPFNANAPTESEFDISTVASIIAAVEGLIAAQKS
ncbi:MAG: acyl carrier protein [Pseudomonadota bacterium]